MSAEISTEINLTELFILILILMLSFCGEPDIHDALIKRIDPGECTEQRK